MSRAYRIRVNESERRLIRAGDSVCTCIELLEILPKEEMAALLERELIGRGFARDGNVVRKEIDGVRISIDAKSGEVTAEASTEQRVQVQSQKEGIAYDDFGPGEKVVRDALKERARLDLDRQAAQEQERLQRAATEKLEGRLLDVKKELDQAVNRVTAEALKKKAAQIGRIKEIHDDAESGSLTITVEV